MLTTVACRQQNGGEDQRMPRTLCVCTLNLQRGCSRQYRNAAAVFSDTLGPSIG